MKKASVAELKLFFWPWTIFHYFEFCFVKFRAALNVCIEKNQSSTYRLINEAEILVLNAVKYALVTPSILALHYSIELMSFVTDICHVQVGPALQQEQPSIPVRRNGYWSQILNGYNLRNDKSLRASLNKFWSVLILHPCFNRACFVIRTVLDFPKGPLDFSNSNGRVERWQIRLYKFKFALFFFWTGEKHQKVYALLLQPTINPYKLALKKDTSLRFVEGSRS